MRLHIKNTNKQQNHRVHFWTLKTGLTSWLHNTQVWFSSHHVTQFSSQPLNIIVFPAFVLGFLSAHTSPIHAPVPLALNLFCGVPSTSEAKPGPGPSRILTELPHSPLTLNTARNMNLTWRWTQTYHNCPRIPDNQVHSTLDSTLKKERGNKSFLWPVLFSMQSHRPQNQQNSCFSRGLYLVVYQKCRVAFKTETKPTHSVTGGCQLMKLAWGSGPHSLYESIFLHM